jgi:S-adenosylmethionine-dependent methyltransferase
MDSERTMFDTHADAWSAYQQTPWGRVRYRVARETLGRTCARLGGGPLRVLDVGGGDGGDTLPLVAAGHDVTVVDIAPSLLERAVATAGASGATSGGGTSGRLTAVAGSVDDLPSLGLGTFDLVLCHNVLQYLPATGPAVDLLAGAVADDGALSLMAPNPAAEVLVAAARRHDVLEATGLLEASTVRTVTFDHDVRRVGRQEAVAALTAAGFTDLTSYGLRSVTDLIADDARKHEPDYYAGLERLELALCDREPFVRVARLWQLVATRGSRELREN